MEMPCYFVSPKVNPGVILQVNQFNALTKGQKMLAPLGLYFTNYLPYSWEDSSVYFF